jgi:anion-transporting  ArsA/GET3 family ATPase
MEDEFSRRALAVAATLRSNATSFVVVTAPAPDALIEADHFVSELKRLGISLGLIVTNRMPPRFGDSSSSTEQTTAASTSGDLAVAHHVLAELWRDVEQAEAGVQAFLSRTNSLLGAVDTASATEFATDIHDMASIGLLAQQLAAAPSRQ